MLIKVECACMHLYVGVHADLSKVGLASVAILLTWLRRQNMNLKKFYRPKAAYGTLGLVRFAKFFRFYYCSTFICLW